MTTAPSHAPELPDAIPLFSKRMTSIFWRDRKQAMAVPIIPPPITTTSALFQAAVVGGATLAGASAVERELLDVFAKDVGIAFQIADDLLDADTEEAASILRIQGLDDARQGAEGLLERALLGIEGLCERAEPLRELARFAVRRNR